MDTLTEDTPKRFNLQNENFPEVAKQRLRAIKEEVKNLRQEKPEVLSLCMFGSLTTGKSRPDSDIDGYLFIDLDKAAKRKSTLPSNITETEIDDLGTPETLLNDEVSLSYSQPLRDRLKQDLKLSDEQVKHIRSRPISKEIIHEHTENI